MLPSDAPPVGTLMQIGSHVVRVVEVTAEVIVCINSRCCREYIPRVPTEGTEADDRLHQPG